MERMLDYKEFVNRVATIRACHTALKNAGTKAILPLRKEIVNHITDIKEALDDREDNFVKWLNSDICTFVHPETMNRIDVQIGDDYEAIYHFLLYCQKINTGVKIDEDSAEYLAYLISRSNYETEGC